MSAGDERSTSPRRKWLGIRCSHETCERYGICLIGPPLPSELITPTRTTAYAHIESFGPERPAQ